MRYSCLTPLRRTRRMVNVFGGYHHRDHIGPGELYDMRNLTGDAYPLLTPRPRRGFYTGGSDIRRLLAKQELCYADGRELVVGDRRYDLGLSGGQTQLISMGAYIIVLPDGKYLNTANPADRGSMEAVFTAQSARVSMCQKEGNPIYLSDGTQPAEGDYRLENGLQQYTAGAWQTISTTYVRLEAPGIEEQFQVGDGLHLTGVPQIGDTAVVQAKGEDFLVLPGLTQEAVLTDIRAERRLPYLDFCVEAGNRLWGCRYGKDRDGRQVNMIYACKLGDFRNWECFQGLSTDSYAVSLGSDGVFTGAITYLGYPLFFKEEQIHRIFGTEPCNFQVQSDGCRGVQRGSGRSLAIVGETLYYKSRLGVCAYTGGLPVDVSQRLGEEHYGRAVAGAYGMKYYISMADREGVYHLFVYDTQRDLWHREDNTRVLDFAAWENDLYFIDAADGQIKTVYAVNTTADPAPISWMAQTALLGVDDPDQKYLSTISLRIQLGMNSRVDVYLCYDSEVNWIYTGTIQTRGIRTLNLPLRLRRCDHVRIKLEGTGEAKLFSLTTTTGSAGSAG